MKEASGAKSRYCLLKLDIPLVSFGDDKGSSWR